MIRRRDFVLTGTALGGWAAIGLPRPAWAASAAQTAVDAAKEYAGTEISIVWEAGLQALDPLNFSGPKWKELTGITVKVIEVPTAEMFTKILQEHRAGTGAYDALNVIPSWMPDLVRAGALEALDPYVDKYGYREELQEIAPVYRDNQMTVGRQDLRLPGRRRRLRHVLPHRRPGRSRRSRRPTRPSTAADLPVPPTTWKEFDQVGALDHRGHRRQALWCRLLPRCRPTASSCSRSASATRAASSSMPRRMKATVNGPAGVKVFSDWLAENKWMPPGVRDLGLRREPGGLPARATRP